MTDEIGEIWVIERRSHGKRIWWPEDIFPTERTARRALEDELALPNLDYDARVRRFVAAQEAGNG